MIITGETARKENANEVLEALSDLAGDFVVATAGPDLESVLSARGRAPTPCPRKSARPSPMWTSAAGPATSPSMRRACCGGPAASTSAGGSSRWKTAASATFSPRSRPWPPPTESRWRWADRALSRAALRRVPPHGGPTGPGLRLAGADSHHAGLYTNNGKPLPEQPTIAAVTYSGGVADCIYQEMEGDVFRFGDIGVLLGKAIRADPDLSRVERFTSIETIRATVVGAGTHTTEVSGSTIHYEQGTLPLKNVPILKVSEEDEASLETLKASILNQMPLYMPEGKAEQLAIAFTGEKRTSFADIQALAAAIIESTKEVISSRYPLVVVVENDIGKVLGNALNVLLKREKDVICIDGIRTLSGDYIDIGEPIAGGQVLPVVIKTLIFNS